MSFRLHYEHPSFSTPSTSSSHSSPDPVSHPTKHKTSSSLSSFSSSSSSTNPLLVPHHNHFLLSSIFPSARQSLVSSSPRYVPSANSTPTSAPKPQQTLQHSAPPAQPLPEPRLPTDSTGSHCIVLPRRLSELTRNNSSSSAKRRRQSAIGPTNNLTADTAAPLAHPPKSASNSQKTPTQLLKTTLTSNHETTHTSKLHKAQTREPSKIQQHIPVNTHKLQHDQPLDPLSPRSSKSHSPSTTNLQETSLKHSTTELPSISIDSSIPSIISKPITKSPALSTDPAKSPFSGLPKHSSLPASDSNYTKQWASAEMSSAISPTDTKTSLSPRQSPVRRAQSTREDPLSVVPASLPTFHHATLPTGTTILPPKIDTDAFNSIYVSLPDTDQTTRSKQAAKLATLFINFKLANEQVPSELHGISTSGPSSHDHKTTPMEPIASGSILENQILENFQRPINPSVETMFRAQRARANLELHYDMLASYQGKSIVSPEDDSTDEAQTRNKLPGFFCYNPLQVIRNRKYRIAPGSLDPSTKHNHQHHHHHHHHQNSLHHNSFQRGERDQQFNSPGHHYWTVDISEFIVDFSWKAQNYFLMHGPSGQLLYPDHSTENRKSEPKQTVPSGKPDSSKRLLVSGLNKLKQNFTVTGGRSGAPVSNPTVESPPPETSAPESLKSNSEDPLSAVEEFRSNIRDVPIESIRREQQMPPEPSGSQKNSSASSSISGYDSRKNSVAFVPPMVVVNDSKPIVVPVVRASIDNGSSSSSTSQKATSMTVTTAVSTDAAEQVMAEASVTKEDAECSEQSICVRLQDFQQQETEAYASEFKFLELVFLLHHFSVTNRSVLSGTDNSGVRCYFRNEYPSASVREREAKLISSDFNSTIRSVQKDLVPRVRGSVIQSETRLQSLRRTRLSTTSTRIDKLLADSDQTINRLSTTLNVEINQLSERMDFLEHKQSTTMLFKYKWVIVHLGYRLLEYMVLLLMWFAWGLVSVLLGVKGVFRCALNVLRWLLWC